AAQASPPQHGQRKRPSVRDRAAAAGAGAAAPGTARGAAPQDQDGPRTTASARSDGSPPVRTDDGPAGRIPPAGSGPVPPRRPGARGKSLLRDNGPKGPSRRTMTGVLVAMVIAVIAVVVFVMVQVGDVFGAGSDAPLTQQNIGLNPTTTA